MISNLVGKTQERHVELSLSKSTNYKADKILYLIQQRKILIEIVKRALQLKQSTESICNIQRKRVKEIEINVRRDK